MLAWFDRLSLRAKLALGFGILIFMMLAGAATAILGHRHALQAMEAFLESDNRIAELSEESRAAMGQARRYEKEFLLKVRVFGFEEARSRYSTLVMDQLDRLRGWMAAIRDVTADPGMATETRAIEELSRRYEAGFLRVVELHGRLGRVDTGLEGQMRSHAHAIEALLDEGAPDRLRADLLTLRRHEKDFILRGQSRFAAAFEAAAERFQVNLARAPIFSARRLVLARLGDQYRQSFREFVALEGEIDATTLDYLEAAHQVEPRLEALHDRADEAAEATRATMARVNRAVTLLLLSMGAAATVLGLLVASLIVRNADRAVGACVGFATRLAGADWSARLPSPGGSGELATLAGALNRMADALQESHGREVARTAELLRLNRTLGMLSRCNEALVRARDERELLQAVCREIVAGGYSLAWVGFARHDEAHTVEPAAYAGSGGDYVENLHLTWGDNERRQGVGGRAIREGWPAVARHILTDPVFEPWRNDALRHGYGSCLALPLKGQQEVLGTLSIYAAEADAFDAAELKLLQELADDLAFGIVSLREGQARQEAEAALDYHATHDPVTGLANLTLFRDRLHQALAHAGREGHPVAVMSLSLDRFAAVRDSLGHAAGDALLRHVAASLLSHLREGDTVARVAGDEFAVAIDGLAGEEDAALVAMKLQAAVADPLELDGRQLVSSASVGICLCPKDGAEADKLLQNAGAARSAARDSGGGQFRFYAAEMNARMAAHFAMEADLRRALDDGELRVHYQPRANLAGGEISGAEALVRWQHPDNGLVPPGDFIPLAERTGLIIPMGAWVIREVCRHLRAWLDAGLPAPAVAFNLSARQFRDKGLPALIRDELEANGLEPRYLEAEITESTLMDNVEDAVAILAQLKAIGIKLSLDDFGTGHSSLSRLRDLPIDHLKIDQSFVRNLTTDPQDAAICLGIIGLAHNLRMTVIAEGVETEGQAAYLRQHHCDEMQGYWYGRPIPADQFRDFLAARSTLALPTAAPEERRTILLVDDEANILSALKRLLRRDGYEIHTAGSAREGLEILSVHKIQVIISDQRMPEMNGTEFLSRVRDLYPGTVRMVLSGYTELGSITDAINKGAIYKFLTKPWEDEALRADVREAFLHYESSRARTPAAP